MKVETMKDEMKEMLVEMQKAQEKQISLLPNTEEEALQVKLLSAQDPVQVFDRIREILSELTFLTDIVDDTTFESNQDILEVLMEDYTQLFELCMARGLVMEDEGADGSAKDLPSLAHNSPDNYKGEQLGKITSLHEISEQKMDTMDYRDIEEQLGYGEEEEEEEEDYGDEENLNNVKNEYF